MIAIQLHEVQKLNSLRYASRTILGAEKCS